MVNMAANEPPPLNQQGYGVPVVSPSGTTVLVGGASVPAIGANITRRGITFINPNLNGPIIRVCPSNQAAVIGQGVPVLPGGQVSFLGNDLIRYSSGWNTIADTGSNNPLTILEML
jgi:hypothetical protein